MTNANQSPRSQDRSGGSRWPAFLWRRNIVSDVVQGIIIGGVLAFITFQIIAHAYVTKVNGWTTMFGCGEPGNGMLLRAACDANIPWPDKRTARGDVLDDEHRWRGPYALRTARLHHALSGRADFRRTMRSGRSRWATREITLCRIRSIGTASAIAPASCRTPTAPSTFTSRTPLRQAMNPTGCPHPQAISYSGCACICPAQPFSTASTRCRRSSRHDDIAYEVQHLLTFGSVMVVAWVIGTFLFIYFWPHLVTNHFKRAILDQGFGDGPIPINTLYTEPQTLFADPLHRARLRPQI